MNKRLRIASLVLATSAVLLTAACQPAVTSHHATPAPTRSTPPVFTTRSVDPCKVISAADATAIAHSATMAIAPISGPSLQVFVPSSTRAKYKQRICNYAVNLKSNSAVQVVTYVEPNSSRPAFNEERTSDQNDNYTCKPASLTTLPFSSNHSVQIAFYCKSNTDSHSDALFTMKNGITVRVWATGTDVPVKLDLAARLALNGLEKTDYTSL